MKYIVYILICLFLIAGKNSNSNLESSNLETLCSGIEIKPGMTFICIDSLELLGTCYGYVNCSACSTCNYCKYCNSGGSCGICGKRPIRKVERPVKQKKTYINKKPKSEPLRLNNLDRQKETELSAKAKVQENYHLKSFDFINSHYVNLRALPSINSNIISTLKKETKVEILGKSLYTQTINKYGKYYWIKVKALGKEGWVFQPLLKINTLDINQISSLVFPSKSVHVRKVNIRAKPTIGSTVLFNLYKNDSVEVLKQSNATQSIEGYGVHYWFFINYKGKEGWVYGALII